VWTDLDPDDAHPLSGALGQPARFVYFNQDGTDLIYGVNGFDTLKFWSPGDTDFTDVPDGPPAQDITVLSNRLVLANLTEGGSAEPSFIRWSASNDGTVWPAGAVVNLADTQDPIVGIASIGRLQAAIYRENSIWIMTAQEGTDASAFSFAQLPLSQQINGPINANCIIQAQGIHFFLGRDLRVYAFDGTTVTPVSDPVFPYLQANINQLDQDRCFGVFVAKNRHIQFFFPSSGAKNPDRAVTFNLDGPRWETPSEFREEFAIAFPTVLGGTIDWDTWVPDVPFSWDDIGYETWDDIPAPLTTLGAMIVGVDGVVHEYMNSTSDNMHSIPFEAIWAPFSAEQGRLDISVNWAEFFANETDENSFLNWRIEGWRQPLHFGKNIYSGLINLRIARSFQLPSEPGPTNPANEKFAYIRFAIEGSSGTRLLQSAGALLHIYTHEKPVYNRAREG